MTGGAPSTEPRVPYRRLPVDRALVMDAAHAYQPPADHPELRVEIQQTPEKTVAVIDGDRTHSASLRQLARLFTRLRVPNTIEQVTAAFEDWVNTRPITDREALEEGIACVNWEGMGADPHRVVVVSRDGGTRAPLKWAPAPSTPPLLIKQIRAAAIRRAKALPVTAMDTGDVTVWSHLPNPALSTAVLTTPQVLLDHAPDSGDLWVAFTYGRPLVVANPDAITRLAEGSNEAHVVMPILVAKTIEWGKNRRG